MARSLGNFQAGPIGFHLHVGVVVQMLYHWCPSAYLFSVENVHSVCVWGYLGFSEPGGISFVDKGVGGGAGRAGGGLPWFAWARWAPGGPRQTFPKPSGAGNDPIPVSFPQPRAQCQPLGRQPITDHAPRRQPTTDNSFHNSSIDALTMKAEWLNYQ